MRARSRFYAEAMIPTANRRIPLVVTLMVMLGALLTSFLSFQLMLSGTASMLRRIPLFQDPVGWPFGPYTNPLAIGTTAITLLVLGSLTWLFVRLVSRSVLPGRSAAVFFGTWGAVIVAAWISGIVRAPLMLAILRLPADELDLYLPQLAQFATSGASWALSWGWIAALVAAFMHRSGRARQGFAPQATTGQHPWAPSPATSYPPAAAPAPAHPAEPYPGAPSAQGFPPAAPPSA